MEVMVQLVLLDHKVFKEQLVILVTLDRRVFKEQLVILVLLELLWVTPQGIPLPLVHQQVTSGLEMILDHITQMFLMDQLLVGYRYLVFKV